MDQIADPADELIAMFGKITTNDHDALVSQFARILNTDLSVARFFLEASSWSVEVAVHNYLAETTNGRETFQALSSLPKVTFLSDLSGMQQVVFQPGAPIEMMWSFRNDGVESWPADTQLVFVDGDRMQGPSTVSVRPIMPGEVFTVTQRILAPQRPGTYAGTWRMVCPAGYFGDPVWVIISVGDGPVFGMNPELQYQVPASTGDDAMMDI